MADDLNIPNEDVVQPFPHSFLASISLIEIIGLVSSGAMIFGGIFPYIPQYRMISRSKNAQGFSTLVCLTLLVANILRILFWFGHPFEFPLLVQSVINILCMIVMLELCVRVKQSTVHASSVLAPPVKRFTDFDIQYFWKWTDFNSYMQFIALFFTLGSLLTRLFINFSLYIEMLGKLHATLFF